MRSPRPRGFTLVELIVVIILVGVLAAVALPRFVDLGRSARIASMATLAGALQTTANNVRALCALEPTCDFNNSQQNFMFGGRPATLSYGWLESGDNLGYAQIDAWVTYTGFTPQLLGAATAFYPEGAPDPPNCRVVYFDAYPRGPVLGILVTQQTTGC